MTYSLSSLNRMSLEEFVAALGSVFEDTPAIAEKTWYERPFADISDLHQRMITIVNSLSDAEKLALIRAHPDLGTRLKMAEASVQEQASVGLDQLTPEEYDRFQSLNQRYKDTFGFPFIIAVRNHTKASILEAFEQRLNNSAEAEMQQALTEIGQIAWFRLNDLVALA